MSDVSIFVNRRWTFEFTAKEGTWPDQKPNSWSKQIMRPSKLVVSIQTYPDQDVPQVNSRKVAGYKVLKDGRTSDKILLDGTVWASDGIPAWVFRLTEIALSIATRDYEHSIPKGEISLDVE